MPNEPRWLEPAEVAQLNAYIVEETGEPHLVLNHGLLESACHRPRNRYAYEGLTDVVPLALELMFGIAKNHPFQQGNKRTGFEAAILFLEANGYDFIITDSEDLAQRIVDVITGAVSLTDFEGHIRPYVVPMD